MSFLLLAAIAVDLAADTRCDEGLGITTVLTATPGADASDSCGTTCVPDCFCCALALATDGPRLLARSTPVADAVTCLTLPASNGINLPPYRPPISVL